MKIGIASQTYVKKLGLEAGLKRMKADGYDCIDYDALANTETPVFHCSETEFASAMKHIRTCVEDCGLQIWQTHGPWRWPIQDATPENRAERFEKMTRAILGTALLGCRFFVIHPIMPFGEVDTDPAFTWDINLDFMTRLAGFAAGHGVTVCLENMPFRQQSIATPEECLRLVREIHSPSLKMCLDTGHSILRGVQPGGAVRLLGRDMLAALHVHDNDGTRDLHQYPFSGVMDWGDFCKALQEIGFDGAMSLEAELEEGREAELYQTAVRLVGNVVQA